MTRSTGQPQLTVSPSGEHAELALRESMVLMTPVVRWLIRSGVQHGAFSAALKAVFIDVAQQELQRSGTRVTDSAISVMSGVHRKDIRALGVGRPRAVMPRSVSLVSQLFTRWVTDARFRDEQGRPRALPRAGDSGSFEALAREVSSDVHPRTLLAEMERLGLIELDDRQVALRVEAFVPTQGLRELVALFAANAGDHLAAAVHNLTTDGPRFLEQSVFAEGLSRQSAEELGEIARALWSMAFQRMVDETQRRCDADANQEGETHRMRFGVYYYSEPYRGEPASGDTPPDEPTGSP
ncbi:DUF6502 family protein [Caldimonas tepidiphila]|uniref:DUF6502 family protein n=1 Tax=Caldimonas tepidiphila TaxID=2315841 RepID=UPI000E5B4281|nr:DUF6502 family protein [Caldimonas tepidiphila]